MSIAEILAAIITGAAIVLITVREAERLFANLGEEMRLPKEGVDPKKWKSGGEAGTCQPYVLLLAITAFTAILRRDSLKHERVNEWHL